MNINGNKEILYSGTIGSPYIHDAFSLPINLAYSNASVLQEIVLSKNNVNKNNDNN
jgi:hypothetical protein